MIRGLTSTTLWTTLACAVGIGLFMVKNDVKDLETRLGGINRDIQHTQEEIHVLKAEWSYLNDPVRLRAEAEKHLGMLPMAPAQIATLDTLPDAPLPVVAAAEPPRKLAKTEPPKTPPAKDSRGGQPPAPKPGPKKPSASSRFATLSPPVTQAAEAAPPPIASTPGAPTPGRKVFVVTSPAMATTEQPNSGPEAR